MLATDRNAEVYREYMRLFLANNRPPTRREVMESLGMKVPTMDHHLSRLVSLGLLAWHPNRKGGRNYTPAGVRIRLEYEDTPAGRRAREILETPPPA